MLHLGPSYQSPLPQMPIRDNSDFGYFLLPIYSFHELAGAVRAGTWSSRTVYVLSHLFGAIPHFAVIMSVVKNIFSGINRQTPPVGKALSVKNDIFLDDSPLEDFDGIKGDADPYEHGYSIDQDERLARLLQEAADREHALRLSGSRSHLIHSKRDYDPQIPMDDEEYARILQSGFYSEGWQDFTSEETAVPKQADPQNEPLQEELDDEEVDATTILKGAGELLGTPGLKEVIVKGDDDEMPPCIELIRENLRGAAAIVTKECPDAISPASLKLQRSLNFEQYTAFMLKRFSHTHEIDGCVTLPGGKQLKLEGFFDVFTAPMIISSFRDFAKQSPLVTPSQRDWIAKRFQDIMFCDYVSKSDVQEMMPKLQSSGFKGPLLQSTGFDIHCAASIWYQDLLFYCDRGSDHIQHGIYVFKIPDRSLITEDFIWERMKKEDIKEKDYDILSTILSELNAEVIHFEPMTSQHVGNCTYASMESVLLALMTIELVDSGKADGEKLWKTAFEKAERIFDEWSRYDKDMVFDALVSDIEEWLVDEGDFGKLDLRKTYSEVLTYWKFSHHHNRDPVREKKVDSLLSLLHKSS